MKQFI